MLEGPRAEEFGQLLCPVHPDRPVHPDPNCLAHLPCIHPRTSCDAQIGPLRFRRLDAGSAASSAAASATRAAVRCGAPPSEALPLACNRRSAAWLGLGLG